MDCDISKLSRQEVPETEFSAGKTTSSLNVNQYRWINFWTSILG